MEHCYENRFYRPRQCRREAGGSLLRNGHDLTVRDLDRDAAQPFLDDGARWGESPAEMTVDCEMIITCLPSPAASAAVVEGNDGVLAAMAPGKIWAEMSTTDEAEVKRLGRTRCRARWISR